MDGPGGAGKSTVARAVADRLRYRYIDTGAMYRAVTLKLLALAGTAQAVALERAGAVAGDCDIQFRRDGAHQIVLLDGADVTGALRQPEIDRLAPRVAEVPAVRAALVAAQRRLGASGGVVMDGRDVGTCIFPDAEFKFFVTASAAERAARRYQELRRRGAEVTYPEVERELAERDRRDQERAVAPLRPAADAILIDTTGRTVDAVVARVLAVVAGGDDHLYAVPAGPGHAGCRGTDP